EAAAPTRRVRIAATRARRAPAPPVDVDGSQDHGALQDRLEREVDAGLVEALVEDADDDGARGGPGYRADPAGEAGAAHDHRGDGVELEALPGAGLGRIKLRGMDQAG